MSHTECPYEPLVVEAVLGGAWQRDADNELAAHAEACQICREVATIATLLHDDHERSRYETRVPAAGQVWWRSAIRARLESTHSAVRPMTWLHAITGAIAIGMFLAVVTAAWPFLPSIIDRVWAVAVEFFPNADVAAALASGLRQTAIMGMLAAAILVLAPLAVYFALSRE